MRILKPLNNVTLMAPSSKTLLTCNVDFTARRYAQRCAHNRRESVCLPFCPSVCPSHSSILSTRLKVSSCFFLGMVAPSFLSFSIFEESEIDVGHQNSSSRPISDCILETLIGSHAPNQSVSVRWCWATWKAGREGSNFCRESPYHARLPFD